jgi:preprotein translocase subunit SecF
MAGLQPVLGPLSSNGTSIDTIGPTLGSRLLRGSLLSLLVSFAAIAAYISFRYSGIFALLALLCLAHDVLITCGLFAWLGLLRGVEVDSLFAVALITVAGYSVTDTVVVYDRIREQKSALADLPLTEQVDVAVDATLTRSLYTSLTTLLPLIGLIFFGGSSLFWFAIALALGIAVGSWSSIGLAPTLLPLLSRP